MRRTLAATLTVLALALALLGGPAPAFELEEETLFPAATTPGAELTILSTTDTAIIRPLIHAFQAANPGLALRYAVASSTEVYAAIHDDKAPYDLVISSAMDLQMKLANDGFAQGYRSPQTQALPSWARWRDQLYAVAQEPVVTILSRSGFAGLPLPQTRADLLSEMRDHPARFRGRIGTYDPAQSGAGYLFATQDARQSDTFWRLAEVMGGLDPQLYAGSAGMIADLQSGKLIVAYNVLGSYAAASLPPDGDAVIVEPEDFTHILLRTALIPRNAADPALGAAFLDFLLSPEGQTLLDEKAGLPRINEAALAAGQNLRPIRLDPGLLVYVDPLKRARFLREWAAAVVQP